MRKILIVDDILINRQMLKHVLSKEYETAEASDGAQALEYLCDNYKSVSALLLDIQMPVMDGYELLQHLRENAAFSQLPVIVVTSSEDEQSRVKALNCGANDFITKPFSSEIIRHCLRNNIALYETAAKINAIQRDKLTGLYNREFFFEKAEELIQSQPDGSFLMTCLDIDNFKLVNDRYGAAEGDRILKHISTLLNKTLDAEGGVCGRISGDNFAGLFLNRPDVIERMDSIYRNDFLPQGVAASLHFSIGRYLVADKSLPASAMYDRAYMAKRSIKGRYDVSIAYFDDSMLKALVEEEQVTRDMNRALAEQQFTIWFQPQYNHSNSTLIGAEALVRWQHPQKGLIPPGDFIPVFEQNGFIYELDKYVWEQACQYLRKWLDEGRNPLPISVNISRYDLFREDMVDVLTGLIEAYRLPANLLRLEVTESAFAKSTAHIVRIVKRLIDYGFTVEIDDFGSGYSSLNTLKDVPAQMLKLDMRFLNNSGDSRRGGNILESIVRMAKWLGMAVLAEGVEARQQADFLATIGCVLLQGYLYAKPMPAAEYEALAENNAKGHRPVALETVEAFRPDEFWNPTSLDTLIFSSYVGGACVVEVTKDSCELVRVNNRYLHTLRTNLSSDEILRYDPMLTISESNRKKFFEVVEESAQTGQEFHCEVEKTMFFDTPVHTEYIRYTGSVIAQTKSRKIVYLLLENITAQKNAEQNYQAAAQELQMLNNNLPGGVAVYELAAESVRTTYFNDGFCALLGYTRAQFEKQKPFSSLYASEHARLAHHQQLLRNGQKEVEGICRVHVRGGGCKWLHFKAAVSSRHGQTLLVNILLLDETAQHLATERLRISEEENRLAAQHSGSLISRYNVGSRTLFISEQAAQRYHIPAMLENIPHSVIQTGKLSPNSEQAFIKLFEDIRRGSPNGSATYEYKTAEGWRWMQARYSTVFGSGKKPVSAILSFFDVTEQVEKEAISIKWQQSLAEKAPDSYTLFRCNLSKDTSFDTQQGFLLQLQFDDAPHSFNERTMQYATSVHPDDRNNYVSFVNSDRLLASYYRGKRLQTLEYRELLAGGAYRWLRLKVELLELPNSNDVAAYLLYENIHEEKVQALETQLRAETDSLTGIANRIAFSEQLQKLLAQRSVDSLLALFMIDLDNFKKINDSFGHAVGDETLIEVAQKLRSAVRHSDLLCRLGGDEFLVCLNGLPTLSAIEQKAQLICDVLRKSFSPQVLLTVSMGIAVCPNDAGDIDALYHKADLALYHVKETGKGRAAFYCDEMSGEKPRP